MRPRILLTVVGLALLLGAVLSFRWLSAESGPRGVDTLGEERPRAAGIANHPRPVAVALPPAKSGDRDGKVARYQELHQRLLRARTVRQEKSEAPAAEPSGAPTMPALPSRGHLDKEYVREQMQDIVPLFVECYEMALEEEPALAGKVVIEMVLIGEEEVGGLIESSQVLTEESEVTSPPFLECVQESMYAIELDAPEDGGSITIRYPLVFRPGE